MSGRKVTDADVDLEMVRRRWARPVLGGFEGMPLNVLVRPIIPSGVTEMERAGFAAEYHRRRAIVRADLVKRKQGRKPASDDLDLAELLARSWMVETGTRNRTEAARRVVALLDDRGVKLTVQAVTDRLRK